MACGACLLDGHGDTLAAIVQSKARSCCGPTSIDAANPVAMSIGDVVTDDACGKTFLPPVTFLWPSDVRDKKSELDAQWIATDSAIRGCAALPSAQLVGWAKDFTAWKDFAAEDVGWFGSANKMETALRFQCKLRQWQDILAATSCQLAGPKVPIPTPATTLDEAMSAVKVIAIGGAVIAGVVLVAPVVWEYVGSKRLASGRKSR